jgi:hypothetical protein
VETENKKLAIGICLISVLLGFYLVLSSLGFLPIDMERWHIPRPLIGALGLLLVCAGGATVTGGGQRLNDFFAGVMMLCFCLIGGWVSIYSDGNFEGGVSFLAKESNVSLGRIMFGSGAVITFLCSVFAFKAALLGRKNHDTEK